MLTRRAVLGQAAMVAAAPLARPALAQMRTRVRIACGGVALYPYLPFFVALGQEMFQRHDIEPDLILFPGGAAALQAVLAGSAQIGCGFYEHTVQQAARGQDLVAFVLQARNSGLVLGARRAREEFRTIASLKGHTIGVSDPGSATHLFAMQLFARAGLETTDFAAVGVGTTQHALRAFESGEVDALSMFDPVMMDLERRGLVTILADARTAEGTQAIFGGPYASGSLYARARWIDRNAAACHGCAGAILEAVAFLRVATAPQAMAAIQKGMCVVGDDICARAFTSNRDAYEHAGAVTEDMAHTVRRMLASCDPAIDAADFDLSLTYTDRFVAG